MTTDIYDDAERQNSQLDQTVSSLHLSLDAGAFRRVYLSLQVLIPCLSQTNTFASFANSFLRTTTNSARTFANSSGVKQYKLTLYIIGGFVLVWLLWKLGAARWTRDGTGAP